MRISKLFTIPEGEKVTEKKLRSVLVASVCSILLCMTCLVSTTWAWFSVSVENKGNVIVPYWQDGAAWFLDGVEVSEGVTLSKGENKFIIHHCSAADDLGRKCDLYVTFSVDSSAQNCIKLCKENGYSTEVTLIVPDDSREHHLFWGVSRSAPGSITVYDSGIVEITVEAAEITGTESGEGATGGDNAGTESGEGATGGDNAGTGSGEDTTGGGNTGTESGEGTTSGDNTGTDENKPNGDSTTDNGSDEDEPIGDNTTDDDSAADKPDGDDTTGNSNSNNEQGGNENGNSSSQTTTEPEVTPDTQEPTEEEPSGEA